MGTLNAFYFESSPQAAETEWADDLDLDISRAFEQIRRTDDEHPAAAEPADNAGFTIVIWPDEFQ
jgi:hypothetical protein